MLTRCYNVFAFNRRFNLRITRMKDKYLKRKYPLNVVYVYALPYKYKKNKFEPWDEEK